MSLSASIQTISTCSGCMIAVELFSKIGTSMNLMTFSTFVVVSLEGLIRNPKHLINRHIPLREYAQLVTLFFIVSIANNQLINLDIPFSLFIIFRSGTLLANVILTFLLRNQRYSGIRFFSVALVTLGIALFTWQEHKINQEKQTHNSNTTASIRHSHIYRALPFQPFISGVLVMCFCLFGSAYMGIMQENLYHKYGKHPREMMFFVHLISLPLFIFVAPDILEDAKMISRAEYFSVTQLVELTLPVPRQWFLLLAVISLQWLCINQVYQLTAQLSSLQLTMVLTLRKFLNLLFSVLLFRNAFTLTHLVASVMVIFGSFQFYDGFTILLRSLRRKRKDVKVD